MCCNGFININISTDVFRIFALNMILMLVIMITTVARKSNKLCYDITGEYNLDLISSISKYATCIFNDGEGGYIKWNSNLKKMFDINDVVSAMRSEISKIKPVVHEMKYQFTYLQQTAEVCIEIAPVPWGLEAYAAPDGHVYIAGVAGDLTNANSSSNGNDETLHTNSEIKHENNFETQDDIAMETSDYWVGLTSGSISKAEEKETGMLPCEIKSIIDDCVQDLRDIKSTLGIHSTLERPVKEEINTLPQQKTSTNNKLHHCKSQSDQLYNESQQSMRHWKSDPVVSDISGSNGFKTLCEEIPFIPCRDGKTLPSANSNLLQVDGEERGDIDFLPQLDGVYDQNIVKEESNSGSEAYKLQEFYDLQKHKSSIVIFWLGLVLVALVQYVSRPIVFPIPNSDCDITCQNGGTLDPYACICDCSQHWRRCLLIIPCTYVCYKNGGNLDADACICDCSPHWTGDQCENCDTTCLHGSTFDADTCICDCLPHWSGDECEKERTTHKHLTPEVTTIMWPIIRAAVLSVLIIAVTIIVLRHRRAKSEKVARTHAQQVNNELNDISGKSPTNETHDSESRDIEHQYQDIEDTIDLQNTVRKAEYENVGIYEITIKPGFLTATIPRLLNAVIQAEGSLRMVQQESSHFVLCVSKFETQKHIRRMAGKNHCPVQQGTVITLQNNQ